MISYLKIFKIFLPIQVNSKIVVKEKIGLQTGQNYDPLRGIGTSTLYSYKYKRRHTIHATIKYLINTRVDKSFNHAHITPTTCH